MSEFDPVSFIMGAKSGSGGGGGGVSIPAPSAVTYGTVPAVSKTVEVGNYIVPVQTVTYRDGFPYYVEPVEGWSDFFVAGATLWWTVDDEQYSGKVYADGGYLWVEAPTGIGGNWCGFNTSENGNLTFMHGGQPASAVVSLYTGENHYQYSADPYPGYDFVFVCNATRWSSDGSDYSMIKGSHDLAISKFKAGQPITALLTLRYIYSEGATYDDNQAVLPLSTVNRYDWYDDEDDCIIEFTFDRAYLLLSGTSGSGGATLMQSTVGVAINSMDSIEGASAPADRKSVVINVP